MIDKLTQFGVEILQQKDITNVPTVKASEANIENTLALVFSVLGAIAFLVITVAGFRYTISQGDPTKTANAKNTIIYASIGLVVAASAAVFVKFVLGRL